MSSASAAAVRGAFGLADLTIGLSAAHRSPPAAEAVVSSMPDCDAAMTSMDAPPSGRDEFRSFVRGQRASSPATQLSEQRY